jgi:hypothetical protein
MELMAKVNWVNRHAAVILTALLLLAICTIAHVIALAKMDIVNRQFPIMNARTEHSMALIDFSNNHWWFAGGFAFLFIGSLLFLELRNAPRWSILLAFLLLAVPCVVYLMVCSYIANKFTFLAFNFHAS